MTMAKAVNTKSRQYSEARDPIAAMLNEEGAADHARAVAEEIKRPMSMTSGFVSCTA